MILGEGSGSDVCGQVKGQQCVNGFEGSLRISPSGLHKNAFEHHGSRL